MRQSIGDTIKVHTTVENTGKVAGSEVIQIYIHDPYSTLAKPEKELKAFEKVKLAPGEKKNVTFAIAIRDLASYDMDLEQFAVEEGYYDILAATSSAAEDVFGETRIYLDVKILHIVIVWIHSSRSSARMRHCLQRQIRRGQPRAGISA